MKQAYKPSQLSVYLLAMAVMALLTFVWSCHWYPYSPKNRDQQKVVQVPHKECKAPHEARPERLFKVKDLPGIAYRYTTYSRFDGTEGPTVFPLFGLLSVLVNLLLGVLVLGCKRARNASPKTKVWLFTATIVQGVITAPFLFSHVGNFPGFPILPLGMAVLIALYGTVFALLDLPKPKDWFMKKVWEGDLFPLTKNSFIGLPWGFMMFSLTYEMLIINVNSFFVHACNHIAIIIGSSFLVLVARGFIVAKTRDANYG